MRHLVLIACLSLSTLITTVQAEDSDRAKKDAIIVRAIERMDGYDYSNDEHVKAAIARHIQRHAGTPEYLALAKRFQPAGMNRELQRMILGDFDPSLQVEATRMLADREDGPQQLRKWLWSDDETQAAHIAKLLGLLGNGRAINMLRDVAADEKRPYQVRKNAITGLARNRNGEQALLQLAESKSLVPDTRMLAGGILSRSRDADVRKRAAELLPQPQQKDQAPLEPIDKLAAMRGDPKNGLKLFRGVATCANCHVVGDFGKEVGPNLSEIGNKLSREAMLTSILDPSAGISHNYENYLVLTDSGQIISGLKISETDQAVVIRTPEAIDRVIPRDEIEEMKVSEKSIMPDNLHQTIDQQGLIDLVEYLMTLKKPS